MQQDPLIFMMGKYEAAIPRDRFYSENHLWLREHEGAWRVGLSAYSVRLLQDVYFLEWTIDPNTNVRAKQEIGEIESSKAVSSLYAPTDGMLIKFNEALLEDPTPINTDAYGDGWLYAMTHEAKLLTAEEYVKHLESHWDDAQRLLKGQVN